MKADSKFQVVSVCKQGLCGDRAVKSAIAVKIKSPPQTALHLLLNWRLTPYMPIPLLHSSNIFLPMDLLPMRWCIGPYWFVILNTNLALSDIYYIVFPIWDHDKDLLVNQQRYNCKNKHKDNGARSETETKFATDCLALPLGTSKKNVLYDMIWVLNRGGGVSVPNHLKRYHHRWR